MLQNLFLFFSTNNKWWTHGALSSTKMWFVTLWLQTVVNSSVGNCNVHIKRGFFSGKVISLYSHKLHLKHYTFWFYSLVACLFFLFFAIYILVLRIKWKHAKFSEKLSGTVAQTCTTEIKQPLANRSTCEFYDILEHNYRPCMHSGGSILSKYFFRLIWSILHLQYINAI